MTLGLLLPLLLIGQMMPPREYGFNINFGIKKTIGNPSQPTSPAPNGEQPAPNGQTPAPNGQTPAPTSAAPDGTTAATTSRKRRSLAPFSMEDDFAFLNQVHQNGRFQRDENHLREIGNMKALKEAFPFLQGEPVKNNTGTSEDSSSTSAAGNETTEFLRNRLYTYLLPKLLKGRGTSTELSMPVSEGSSDLESSSDNKVKLETTVTSDNPEFGKSQQTGAEDDENRVSEIMKSLSNDFISQSTVFQSVTSDQTEKSVSSSETGESVSRYSETVKPESAASDHVTVVSDTKDIPVSPTSHSASGSDSTIDANDISEYSSRDKTSSTTLPEDFTEKEEEEVEATSVSEPDTEITNIVTNSSEEDYITNNDSSDTEAVENPITSSELSSPGGDVNKIGNSFNKVDSIFFVYQMLPKDIEQTNENQKRALNVPSAFLPVHALEERRSKREIESSQGKNLKGENSSLIVLPLNFDIEDDRRGGDLMNKPQQETPYKNFSNIASESRERLLGLYYPLLYEMVLKPKETDVPITQMFKDQLKYNESFTEVGKEKEINENTNKLANILKACYNKVSSSQLEVQSGVSYLYNILEDLRKCLEESTGVSNNDNILLQNTFAKQDRNYLDSSLFYRNIRESSFNNPLGNNPLLSSTDILDSQKIFETLESIFAASDGSKEAVQDAIDETRMASRNLSRRKRLIHPEESGHSTTEIIEKHPNFSDEFVENYREENRYTFIPEISNFEYKSPTVSNLLHSITDSLDAENITSDSNDLENMTRDINSLFRENKPVENSESWSGDEINKSIEDENVSSSTETIVIGDGRTNTGSTEESENRASDDTLFSSSKVETLTDSKEEDLPLEDTTFEEELPEASALNRDTSHSPDEENPTPEVMDVTTLISSDDIQNNLDTGKFLLETTSFKDGLDRTSNLLNEEKQSPETEDAAPSIPNSEIVTASEATLLSQATNFEHELSDSSNLTDKSLSSLNEEILSSKVEDADSLNTKSEVKNSGAGNMLSKDASSTDQLSDFTNEITELPDVKEELDRKMNSENISMDSSAEDKTNTTIVDEENVSASRNYSEDAASPRTYSFVDLESQNTSKRPFGSRHPVIIFHDKTESPESFDSETTVRKIEKEFSPSKKENIFLATQSSSELAISEGLLSSEESDAMGDISLKSETTSTEKNEEERSTSEENSNATTINDELLAESREPLNFSTKLEETDATVGDIAVGGTDASRVMKVN